MLDNETKRRIDTARDILVGKVPDPKSQVEQITIALIYKFMDDMDAEAEELGGKRKFFSGKFADYSWKKLLSPSLGGHEVLNLYAEAIDKMNVNENIPQLFRDIFKNAYLPYRDPETLKSFLKIIDDFNYDHSEKLGDAFEYLLSVLGSQGDAGQFRTPRNIIDLMVYLVDPKKNETILDPACGTAGFLISSYKHIVKNNSSNFTEEKENNFSFGNGDNEKYNGDKLTPDERKKLAVNIQGYDISPDMVRLSLVNLYLHGFTNPKIVEYDTLTSEDKWNEHADIILANPPFMSPKGGIKPHKRFSVESSRSEVLFVDYIAEHLTPNGRAAVIVPEGIIFQSGTAYKTLRKMLVEKYLYAVVSLPAGVFNPYSGVKTSILLMDKTLVKRTNNILFAKIENDGFDLGAQRRANSKSELPAIANAIKEYIKCVNNGTEFNADEFANLVIGTKEKIGENGDWGLSGERYKSYVQLNSNYPIVKIEDVCIVERGASPRPIDRFITTSADGINWIKIGDGSSNSMLIKSTKEMITPEGAKKSKAVKKGDFILSNSMSFGHPYILDIDGCIHDGWLLLRPKEGLFIKEFLYQMLSSEKIYSQFISLATGGVVNNLNSQIVRKVLIPLPPLEIQKEIVAEIEGWQKIIDGARQVVENYKPQIQIDPSWEEKKLGEISEFKNGLNYSQDEYGNKIKLLGVRHFQKNIIAPIDDLDEINIGNVVNDSYLLKEGDLVFVRSNGNQDLVGRSVLIPPITQRVSFSGFTIRCRFTIEIEPLYVAFLLKSEYHRNMMKELGRGANIRNLSQSLLSEIDIPLPSIQIQREITRKIKNEIDLVTNTDKLITIFEQKIKEKIASVWGE